MLERLRLFARLSALLLSTAAFPIAFANAQPAVSVQRPAPGDRRPADEGKLDVSDLEKKYWAAKDVDFSVVQNRAYAKTGRFSLTGQYGYFVNDTYSDISAYRLGVNYYFSERYGIEFNYQSFDAVNSKSTSAFLSQYGGVMPNHNKPQSYYGVSFNWIPIYAKMSLLNSNIIYFDMAISPGIGLTNYQQQIQNSYPTASAPTLSLDITQHFFLSKWFALRFDFQNRWFTEEIKDFRTQRTTSNDMNHSSSLMGGIQLFY